MSLNLLELAVTLQHFCCHVANRSLVAGSRARRWGFALLGLATESGRVGLNVWAGRWMDGRVSGWGKHGNGKRTSLSLLQLARTRSSFKSFFTSSHFSDSGACAMASSVVSPDLTAPLKSQSYAVPYTHA